MKRIPSAQHLSKSIVLWKAVANLAQAYALSRKDLEDTLGFSQATLSRLYQKDVSDASFHYSIFSWIASLCSLRSLAHNDEVQCTFTFQYLAC